MTNFTDLKYHFRNEMLIAENDNIKIKFCEKNSKCPLTPEKAKQLVNIIHDRNIDISNKEKVSITITKDQHKIHDIDSAIVLKISKIHQPTFFESVVNSFRRLIGLICGEKSPQTSQATKEFTSILKTLPQEAISKIGHQLDFLTKDEEKFLHFISTKIHFDNETDRINALLEILNGGYVMVDDNGETCEEWAKAFHFKQERRSSHESSDRQYVIRGPLVKELLFSKKTIIDTSGSERQVTWFQLERYPLNFSYALPHLLSWVIYKVTGHNQGPYGTSLHTEKQDPITVRRS